jgi:hypothetical protein
MTRHRNRRAATIESAALRVTVLEEGGHIAEIVDKATGLNPLWTPDWPSIEPSTYDPSLHPVYGGGVDASLLAGIMGHNLCLDLFGGPSAEEAHAGFPVHGEVSTARFEIERTRASLTMRARLPLAQLLFERRIDLAGRAVRVREQVENLSATDRPVGWTQHVTLGPPFLQHGQTEFRASARRSKVFDGEFGPADYLASGAEFDWPLAPRKDQNGGVRDLRLYTDAGVSSAYTAHQMDPALEHAYFVAFSPASRLAFGYVWRRADFPWMGIWEENRARPGTPWNKRTMTSGWEFGVSPFPESRRQMMERGPLFGTPTCGTIPARGRVSVEYWAILQSSAAIPERLDWPESAIDNRQSV